MSSVVLIGPPGAGKTAVGKALAARLGWSFRDTDAEAEERAGKTVQDIFLEDGEQAFRDLERAAAAAALAGTQNVVVALGSGAVADEAIRDQLNGSATVYLEADFGAVARHAGLDKPRIPLPGNPRGRLRAMLEQRRPVYEALATITVPADEGTPDELAGLIARQLAEQEPEQAPEREREQASEQAPERERER